MDADTARAGLTGGCQCGAVRYRLDAAPTGATVCHCRMCQKAGGAPFMAFAGVARKDFAVTRGRLAAFASSDIAERGFCAACGTPLTYARPDADRVSVTIGSLDRPQDVPPTSQLGVESRLPWCAALATLPEVSIAAWLAANAIASVGDRQHPDHET
jgi:hypothetical protein